jgi:hypothetical protein
MHVKVLNVTIIVLLGLVCTSCSLSYNLNPPISSTAQYDQDKEEQRIIHLVDNRANKQFSEGIGPLKNIDISIGNVEDPIVWLAESLQTEFTARGLSIEVTKEKPIPNSPDLVLTINKYQIISSRTSGFHPYVAYHSFAGKLQAPAKDNKIMAYFLYGKTPVWSMNEVQEPCFNMPASILVKEIAAKINRLAFDYSMSDRQVEELNILVQEQIKNSSPDAYLAVFDLGESNNPKAMDYLTKLADNDDLIIRASALSAIGMLGPENQVDFLKGKYAQYRDIDRFMAIKSIGDIGTPEALEFLKKAQQDPQYNEEYGFKFVTDLYIETAK